VFEIYQLSYAQFFDRGFENYNKSLELRQRYYNDFMNCGIVSIRGLYSGLSELLKIMNLNETISCHHPHNLNLRMQEILLLD
jgi:hypothetical protein